MRVRPSVLAALVLFLAPAVASGRLADGQPLTPETWGARVGFAPDLSNPAFVAGVTIDAAGWRNFEAWIPEGLRDLIERYGLVLRTVSYRPIHPSLGYIDSTSRHSAGVEAVDPGRSIRKKGIRGYVAGLPFPDPQTGAEVAWNHHYAHLGDDGETTFGVYFVDAKRGVVRTEEWTWQYLSRAMHRTDLEPVPSLPWFEARGIQYASLAWAVEPYDKWGATSLYYRNETPDDQQGWLYVPTLRRALRMTFGAPGVPWNGTDFLWEDIRGYSGFPEWMDWTLVGRATILAPMHAGIPTGRTEARGAIDFDDAPHWNPRMDWEPRPVYVVEARPKFRTCPYGRVVMYVDAETFYVPVKVAYDRKGRLWRVFVNAWNESPDAEAVPPPLAVSLGVDVREGSATVLPSYEVRANVGLDPFRFLPTVLQKIGR